MGVIKELLFDVASTDPLSADVGFVGTLGGPTAFSKGGSTSGGKLNVESSTGDLFMTAANAAKDNFYYLSDVSLLDTFEFSSRVYNPWPSGGLGNYEQLGILVCVSDENVQQNSNFYAKLVLGGGADQIQLHRQSGANPASYDMLISTMSASAVANGWPAFSLSWIAYVDLTMHFDRPTNSITPSVTCYDSSNVVLGGVRPTTTPGFHTPPVPAIAIDVNLEASFASGSSAFGTTLSSYNNRPIFTGQWENLTLSSDEYTPPGGSTNGALSVTTDDASVASSGSLVIAGSLVATTDDASVASSGALALAGAATISTEDATLVATGVLVSGVGGTADLATDDASVAAAGSLAIAGSLAATTDDATLASAASLSITGDAALTTDDATATATSTIVAGPSGAVGATTEDATLVAAAELRIAALVAVGLDSATLLSQANLAIRAGMDVTTDDAILVAFQQAPIEPLPEVTGVQKFDYAGARLDAMEIIAEFGQEATLYAEGAPTGPAYDPVAGVVTEYTVTVVDLEIEATARTGGLVGTTKRVLYMANCPVPPQQQWSVRVRGKRHEIVNVKELAPGGIAVMWEVELAK